MKVGTSGRFSKRELFLITGLIISILTTLNQHISAKEGHDKIGITPSEIRKEWGYRVIQYLPKEKVEKIHTKATFLMESLKKAIGSGEISEIECEGYKLPSSLSKKILTLISEARYEKVYLSNPHLRFSWDIQPIYVKLKSEEEIYEIAFGADSLSIHYLETYLEYLSARAKSYRYKYMSYYFFISRRNDYPEVRKELKEFYCSLS